VAINVLIEEELKTRRNAITGGGVVIEERIGANLPAVLADERALRHALQNLIDNALKYGIQPDRLGGS
jgi:signal transduction histidine kinase